MENDPDVGLLTCQALYRLPAELEFMDLFSFPLWFGLRTFSAHKLIRQDTAISDLLAFKQ